MKVPPGICVLIADQGIGDYYISAGFAAAVARTHGVRTWLAGRPDLAFVADLYPAVERYLEWPRNLRAEAVSAFNVTSGGFFFAHFPQLELVRAIGFKDFHFLDAYRCRLGLLPEAQLTRPAPPREDELVRAREFLTNLEAPVGRTVILNLDARSFATDYVNGSYWTLIAGALRTAGLHPLVNAGPRTIVPPGLASVDIPLADFRAITLAAGGICSLRSGISDLVCDLSCPQVVVYPDLKFGGGPLLKGTSFTGFGLDQPPLEVLARRGHANADAREIVAHLTQPSAIAA